MNSINSSPMAQLLLDAGFTDGWALSGETLVLWEHDQDPPAPLEAPNETSNPDT